MIETPVSTSRKASLRAILAEGAAAAVGCLALAVAVTWPLTPHLNDMVLGMTGFENTPQTIWLYAQWKAYTAAGLRDLLGSSPLDPACLGAFLWSQLSFPARVSMANGIDFVFTWPLDAWFGFPAYYNLKCLIVLASNGVGAYALVRGLGGGRVGAAAAGVTLACNPFALYELSTGRLIETMWLPLTLYVLCLVRAWRAEAPMGWIFGAGLSLAASVLVYWFNGWFLFAFTVLWIAAGLVTEWQRGTARRALLRIGLLLMVPLITLPLILPAAMPYLVNLARGDRIPGSLRVDGGSGADDAFARQLMTWSCKADYPFRPPGGGSAFGPPWRLPGMMCFSAVLTLGGLAGLFLLRHGQRFWVLAFLGLYLLPLGPRLCLDGRAAAVGGHEVPMPYAAMVAHLPFLDRLFFPNQAMVMWIIACAAVIGLGVSALRPRAAIVVVAALVGVLPLELRQQGILPAAMSPVVVPPPYLQARSEPESGFVYVPVNLRFWERNERHDRELYNGTDLTHVDYHIALHGRKSLWGRNQYLAGDCAWMFEPRRAMTNTFLRYLLDIDRSDSPYEDEDRRQIRHHGFRYVVVLERLCSHTPAPGGYTTRLQEGSAIYKATCARLCARLGPPVHEGDDPSWDRWLAGDDIVPHTYRMAVFSIDGAAAQEALR